MAAKKKVVRKVTPKSEPEFASEPARDVAPKTESEVAFEPARDVDRGRDLCLQYLRRQPMNAQVFEGRTTDEVLDMCAWIHTR